MFLSRVPSSTTACTWPGAQAPKAPAISTAAQHSQHSANAMAWARFVMGKLGLLFGGTHAPLRAAGVPAPHRLAPHDPALAHRVRVSA